MEDNKILDELLSKKAEFLTIIDKDLDKNTNLLKEMQLEIDSLDSTRENIINLSKMPEHTALVPLCKLLYIPAKIQHSGEYLLEKKAFPASYFTLKTCDQCINELDRRIKDQNVYLQNTNSVISQLKERKKFLLGQQQFDEILSTCKSSNDEEPVSITTEITKEMPKEIRSDKGIALKVGSFYEIVEFE